MIDLGKTGAGDEPPDAGAHQVHQAPLPRGTQARRRRLRGQDWSPHLAIAFPGGLAADVISSVCTVENFMFEDYKQARMGNTYR